MVLDYAEWIGREVIRHDVVSERLAASFGAALAPHLFGGDGLLGLHWCLAPAIHPVENLGPDGAELKGLFLPPIDLPRRMWAGGQVEIFAPLSVGDQISRHSRVGDVTSRQGQSGPLCIVSVFHDIHAGGVLAVRERHDILFRGESAMPVRTGQATARPAPALSWTIEATELLLFRFSALTFNGHRIHYDLPYARGTEGYDGLLVHGPMQALLALNQAATLLGRTPRRLSYRCLAPLTAPQAFQVESSETDEGAETAIYDAGGIRTFSADCER